MSTVRCTSIKLWKVNIPSQVNPSPFNVYPLLQVHVYEPSLFAQAPLVTSHRLGLASHSLTSKLKIKNKINIINLHYWCHRGEYRHRYLIWVWHEDRLSCLVLLITLQFFVNGAMHNLMIVFWIVIVLNLSKSMEV